jgi:hypothetical protein
MALTAGAQEQPKEEPKKEEAKPDDGLPPPPERPKSLEEAVKKADIIFIGVVDYIGDKPGGWGRPPYAPSSQFIRYLPVKFLKGSCDAKKITVIHELLKGAKLVVEPGALNPQIFDMDKKVILLVNSPPINSNPITFLSQDPNFGAMAWSEEAEKQIAALIAKP